MLPHICCLYIISLEYCVILFYLDLAISFILSFFGEYFLRSTRILHMKLIELTGINILKTSESIVYTLQQ